MWPFFVVRSGACRRQAGSCHQSRMPALLRPANPLTPPRPTYPRATQASAPTCLCTDHAVPRPVRRACCCATCRPSPGSLGSTACGRPPSAPLCARSCCARTGSSSSHRGSRARRRGCGCCRCPSCSSSLLRRQESGATGFRSRPLGMLAGQHPRRPWQRPEEPQLIGTKRPVGAFSPEWPPTVRNALHAMTATNHNPAPGARSGAGLAQWGGCV